MNQKLRDDKDALLHDSSNSINESNSVNVSSLILEKVGDD